MVESTAAPPSGVLVERNGEIAGQPLAAVRLAKERLRELTQAQFDDILVAAKKYQKRAFESGEPQRAMAAFLAARRPK